MTRRRTPEADAQRAIVHALRVVLPRGAIVHHAANEVTAGDRRAKLRQAILVGMGVHPGFADLIVLSGGRVLFLEVKSRTGRLSPAQIVFRDAVQAQGFGWALVRSVEDCAGRLGRSRFYNPRAGAARPAPFRRREDRAMSHKGTNWAIQQRGLKPATKIVLWHLCDRHNPDFGCFPTQARLANDAEMSISALNEHLAKLEAAGLIQRVRSHDPRTHKRQATRYILGFEEGFPPAPPPETGPCPETGHGAISGFSAKPSPDFAQSHLRNPETNLVREPLREPVKEEEDAQAREANFNLFFGALLNALGFDPDGTLPGWWQGWPPRTHVRRWIDDLGLSQDAILSVARDSRRDHPAPPDGPKALDRAMARAARRNVQVATAHGNGQKVRQQRTPAEPPRRSPDELAAFYAGLVNSDRYLPASMISNTMRDAMLSRGLVTEEQLRLRGVR